MSTPFNICKPDDAIKPYKAILIPPIIHDGIEEQKAISGPKNDTNTVITTVAKIVIIEALHSQISKQFLTVL